MSAEDGQATPPEPRISTGVPELDRILHGGLMPRRPYLIVGPAGTGKTTLALQFLLEGIRQGENCLLVTLEEPPNELRYNHRSMRPEIDRVFVFDAIPDVMRYERTPFKDIAAVRETVRLGDIALDIRKTPELSSVEVTFSALEQTLKTEMARRHYTRLVIDSLTALQFFCMKGVDETVGAQTFLRFLSDLRVTTLLTVELPLEDRETPERLLARGEIHLFRWEHDGVSVRGIGVEKLRGSHHDTRLHPYRISPKGLLVNLELTIDRDTGSPIDRPAPEDAPFGGLPAPTATPPVPAAPTFPGAPFEETAELIEALLVGLHRIGVDRPELVKRLAAARSPANETEAAASVHVLQEVRDEAVAAARWVPPETRTKEARLITAALDRAPPPGTPVSLTPSAAIRGRVPEMVVRIERELSPAPIESPSPVPVAVPSLGPTLVPASAAVPVSSPAPTVLPPAPAPLVENPIVPEPPAPPPEPALTSPASSAQAPASAGATLPSSPPPGPLAQVQALPPPPPPPPTGPEYPAPSSAAGPAGAGRPRAGSGLGSRLRTAISAPEPQVPAPPPPPPPPPPAPGGTLSAPPPLPTVVPAPEEIRAPPARLPPTPAPTPVAHVPPAPAAAPAATLTENPLPRAAPAKSPEPEVPPTASPAAPVAPIAVARGPPPVAPSETTPVPAPSPPPPNVVEPTVAVSPPPGPVVSPEVTPAPVASDSLAPAPAAAPKKRRRAPSKPRRKEAEPGAAAPVTAPTTGGTEPAASAGMEPAPAPKPKPRAPRKKKVSAPPADPPTAPEIGAVPVPPAPSPAPDPERPVEAPPS